MKFNFNCFHLITYSFAGQARYNKHSKISRRNETFNVLISAMLKAPSGAI